MQLYLLSNIALTAELCKPVLLYTTSNPKLFLLFVSAAPHTFLVRFLKKI